MDFDEAYARSKRELADRQRRDRAQDPARTLEQDRRDYMPRGRKLFEKLRAMGFDPKFLEGQGKPGWFSGPEPRRVYIFSDSTSFLGKKLFLFEDGLIANQADGRWNPTDGKGSTGNYVSSDAGSYRLRVDRIEEAFAMAAADGSLVRCSLSEAAMYRKNRWRWKHLNEPQNKSPRG